MQAQMISIHNLSITITSIAVEQWQFEYLPYFLPPNRDFIPFYAKRNAKKQQKKCKNSCYCIVQPNSNKLSSNTANSNTLSDPNLYAGRPSLNKATTVPYKVPSPYEAPPPRYDNIVSKDSGSLRE